MIQVNRIYLIFNSVHFLVDSSDTMKTILIVDASESDRRLMSSLLVKSGYEPIAVEAMEAAKEEVALSPWRSQRSVERNCHPAQ